MFDLPQMPQPMARPAGFVPFFVNPAPDHTLPFALTVAARNVESMMAGEATHFELDRTSPLWMMPCTLRSCCRANLVPTRHLR